MPVELELKYQLNRTVQPDVIPDPRGYQIPGLPMALVTFLEEHPPARFFVQQDSYLEHRALSFRENDSVLRIRDLTVYQRTQKSWKISQVESILTWKGPARAAVAKVREELESVVTPDLLPILEKLGFARDLPVYKHRWSVPARFGGREILVCLDVVRDLGAFCELEIMSGDSMVIADEQIVGEFALRLGLTPGQLISESYAQLLTRR